MSLWSPSLLSAWGAAGGSLKFLAICPPRLHPLIQIWPLLEWLLQWMNIWDATWKGQWSRTNSNDLLVSQAYAQIASLGSKCYCFVELHRKKLSHLKRSENKIQEYFCPRTRGWSRQSTNLDMTAGTVSEPYSASGCLIPDPLTWMWLLMNTFYGKKSIFS